MYWIYISFVSYFLLSILKNGDALGGKDSLYLTVPTASFFPSSVCTPAQGFNKRSSSLKLVHRHGPCSHQNKDTNSPTISQILAQDRIRVSLIKSRIAYPSKTTNKETDSKLALPIKNGKMSLDTYNYIVKVGLGTPKMDLSLIFDTGSDITWTPCKPCPNCYKQKETMFDPVGSKTYSNISCDSDLCGLLKATGSNGECEPSTTCVYKQSYNDGSSSGGFLAKETLTTSTDVFKDFIFGCSNYNKNDNPSKTAGILGLGREQLSFVSQTAHKYGKYFSHCFPSMSSSIGYLTLGKQQVSSNVKFTPFSDSSPTEKQHYFIDLMAIYVAGTKISVNGYSSNGVTAIDSGTVITRLPRKIYEMLRENFKQRMMKYPLTAGEEDLDTCYNLSNYTSVALPKMSFLFKGGVMVDLHPSGILIKDHPTKMCLAFIGDNYPILGNFQQKTLEVVYDVQGEKIGFGKGGCT